MSAENARRYIIGLEVENKSGVLARIAALIASKGYNIESLSVGETHDESISHMTLVVRGDDWVIEQACKQLNRLIDVIRVVDLTDEVIIDRELLLVQVRTDAEHRNEVSRYAEIFRSNIVDVTPETFTMELTGTQDKLDAFVELLRPYGITKLYRTGKVVMPRHKPAQARRVGMPV